MKTQAADRNLIGRTEFAVGIYVEDGHGIGQVVGDDHPARVGSLHLRDRLGEFGIQYVSFAEYQHETA